MSRSTALGRRIVVAAALPIIGLLAVLGTAVAGIKTSIIELVAGAIAAVAVATAAGLALRTNTYVGRLVRAIKGITVDSVLNTATQSEGATSIVLSREATSLPERVGPLNTVAAGVLDVRRAAAEAAIRHADGVRQGFAAPLLRLAQRNQMLLDRQLAYLDGFEDREVDPDVLDRLFKLDQLATEMRRTNEGLMVLTGAAPASFDATPVDLLDVVRGAASGVESYSRVRTSVTSGTWIAGPAVNDLAGLLAELIDNACRYSLPDSPVDVRGTVIDQGVRISVRDGGPGMIESRFSELNQLLARPPLVDRVPGSAGLGLLIASHLASRLGVAVTLRPGSPRGIVATVMVDASLLVDRAASARPLSMGDADASLPLMVAQLRRRDRLASRQTGDSPDDVDNTGPLVGVPDTKPAIDRYFSPFSPAAAPAAVSPASPGGPAGDPDALVAGTRPVFAPLPTPAPHPFDGLPPGPNPAYNSSRHPATANNDGPLFKLADVGAVPTRTLLGETDDLAAHGLVRRVPKASLQRDREDFDFDDLDDIGGGIESFEPETGRSGTNAGTPGAPGSGNAGTGRPSARSGRIRDNALADRRSPDDVRRLFADHQEGIRRARMDSPRGDRRPRPGGNRP